MANFYIEKITATGSGKKPSSVELGSGLNVIYGRSNTGKTCIVRCINFLFGGSTLPFSEKTGYSCVTMKVKTLNGQLTLERKLDENKISVVSSDENIESGKYYAKQGKNIISSVWLSLMGIDEDHQVISNEDFKTKHLTWRTFVHMLMVNEREIDRENSIILPKMPQQQTAFLSALLFLFYDKDFSEFTEREGKKKAIRKAAVEKYINGELVSISKRQQAIADDMGAFKDINVENKIAELVESLSKTEDSISDGMNRSKTLLDEMLQTQEELTQCNMLFSRYQSLKSQYAADIKRLTFIVEGEATMHRMPHDTKCPFCDGKLSIKEQTNYADAAQAELSRIVAQLGGLNESEQDLVTRRAALEQAICKLISEKDDVEALIDAELKPKAKELTEAINGYRAYIQLQNELDIIHRLSDGWNTDLRNMQNEEEPQLKYKPRDFFDDGFWKTIDTYLQDILNECKFKPLVSARLSKEDFDIEVNGNKKAVNYGKGYCAFLNTVVALAFRKYLATHATYNPGLFIIDTPLLGLDEGTTNEAPESIQRALFQYFVDHQNEGQLIVVENINTIPKLDYVASGAKEIVFTKGLSEGRYGFLDGVMN